MKTPQIPPLYTRTTVYTNPGSYITTNCDKRDATVRHGDVT